MQKGKPSPRTVLVLRSTFFDRPAGRVFETVLRRLHLHQGFTIEFGGWLSKGSSAGWLSFSEMARFTCSLYIPTEMSQMRFRDVYHLGLPILVPSLQWLTRLMRHMFASWGQMHEEHSTERLPLPQGAELSKTSHLSSDELSKRVAALAATAKAADSWPFKPFYDAKKDPVAGLTYWLPLSDVCRYPHVVNFDSLPHFLKKVETEDWRVISDKMLKHSKVVTGNVLRFYRRSLSSLVSS